MVLDGTGLDQSNSPTASAPIAVSVHSISKRFGRAQALDEISVDILGSETFALLGPNGAGKSTLMGILCTILQADSGTAKVLGFDARSQPLQLRRQLGVVFQEPSLDNRLTVEENLEFHGLLYDVPQTLRRQRITDLLAMVELSDVRQRLVRTLSPGMRRRVEIARALVHDSRVLILDEPTVGLDAQSRDRIWEYLAEAKRQRDLTMIISTHYIEEVDACDRVCIVDHGKVLALDTPDALRDRHGHEIIRVRPRDAATETAILSAYAGASKLRSGEIVIPSSGSSEAMIDALLSHYGNSIRNLSFDRPSLETVFLSLTGRDLRETKPGDHASLARPLAR
ncbi:ABC transporter ATP-binding protein [Devosia sp. 2618]|uniref:ABC transporter ATP-binding protein n=1 Tax=Devosia sp. 2618 TaxID=3156454 RepID=UPI00339A2674